MRQSQFLFSMILAVMILSCHLDRTIAGDSPLPLPQPADGWEVTQEVIPEGVTVPTAIAVARDGMLYLGQSFANGSIIAISNGKVIMIAQGLGAVHSLEWAGDSLYVASGTKLLRFDFKMQFNDFNFTKQFKDERPAFEELVTGLGPKTFGPGMDPGRGLGSIRAGMDGFLYIAVDDYGIHDATGKDGRKLTMRGGGVIRVRTDGTGLEIVSTGSRSPLSLAFTATDEIFTLEPPDAASRWPGGLFHQIAGGHHGFPYQFLTAAFRTLPSVSGQVVAASGPSVIDTGGALPEACAGGLFYCDPSVNAVVRLALRKSAGTFAPADREELLSPGELSDFHPWGVAALVDGTGFWVLDRGQGGVGRLYRLTHAEAKPVSRMVKEVDSSIPGLMAQLDSPSLGVRLDAQQALTKQGPTARDALIERLRDAKSEPGRIHALWALDAINDASARAAIRSALTDTSARLRLQAARSAGIRADRQAVELLTPLLRDRDPAVRREAAIAMGKIGDRTAIGPLVAVLGDSDRSAAWSIRASIRRLGYPSKDQIREALLDPYRMESALILTDESWALPAVQALVEVFAKLDDPGVRGRILANLMGQYRKYPEWTGEWWGANPLAAFPRKSADWDKAGMETVLQGLNAGIKDQADSVRYQAIVGLGEVGRPASASLREAFTIEADPDNQAAIVEALGAVKDGESLKILIEVATDQAREETLRAAALDTLAQFRGPDVLRARFSLVYDAKTPPSLIARAIPPLVKDSALPQNDLAGFFEHASAEVRAAAIASLMITSQVTPDDRRSVIARLDDPSSDVRQAALAVIGSLQIREAIPRLISDLNRPNFELRSQTIAALCQMPDRRAEAIYRMASTDPDPAISRDGMKALKGLTEARDPAIARASAVPKTTVSVEALRRLATKHKCDPRKGEAVFFTNKTAACATCHAVGGKGAGGREHSLDGLASRQSKEQTIELLLSPPPPLAESHRSVPAMTQILTPFEFADLISYLNRLK